MGAGRVVVRTDAPGRVVVDVGAHRAHRPRAPPAPRRSWCPPLNRPSSGPRPRRRPGPTRRPAARARRRRRRARAAISAAASVSVGGPGPTRPSTTGVRQAAAAARPRVGDLGVGRLGHDGDHLDVRVVVERGQGGERRRRRRRRRTGRGRPTPSTWRTPMPAPSSRPQSCWAPVPDAATSPTGPGTTTLANPSPTPPRITVPQSGPMTRTPALGGLLLERDLGVDVDAVAEHHHVAPGPQGGGRLDVGVRPGHRHDHHRRPRAPAATAASTVCGRDRRPPAPRRPTGPLGQHPLDGGDRGLGAGVVGGPHGDHQVVGRRPPAPGTRPRPAARG